MSLLKIFKSVDRSQYFAIIDVCSNIFPEIIANYFLTSKRGRSNLNNVMPKTVSLIKTINGSQFGLLVLESLLLQILEHDIKSSVYLVRQTILNRFDFLDSFIALELFLNNEQNKMHVSRFISETFNEMFQQFLIIQDFELLPNVDVLIKQMVRKISTFDSTDEVARSKYEILMAEIHVFRMRFDAQISVIITSKLMLSYKLRFNQVIMALLNELHKKTDFFDVVNEKGFKGNFNQPFIKLKENILAEISSKRALLVREHAFPSFVQLNP